MKGEKHFDLSGFFMWVFIFGVCIALIIMAIGDSEIWKNATTEKTGTAYIGELYEIDGRTYECAHVDHAGYCDERNSVGVDSADVAEMFGLNTLGIAKGEAPLLDSSLWYAPFLNVINSTIFSISISFNIAVFTILMVSVLLSGVVIIFGGIFITKTWPTPGTILALYVLPGYVGMLSLSSLSGGAAGLYMLHCVFLFLAGLKIVSKIKMSSTKRMKVTEDGMESKESWTFN